MVKSHKSLIKFGKDAKLSPRFMGTFKVVEKKAHVVGHTGHTERGG
jgi:hypothetical protein